MPTRPRAHHPPGTDRRPPDRRPSASKRGYDRRWRAYRLAYLTTHPLCAECEAEGRYVPATDVDHIIPIEGQDDPRFWDPANHQALCGYHHKAKTRREAKEQPKP